MITPGELEICANKLYFYDVYQGAWEQEPNGAEANIQHVLMHLVKDLGTKRFNVGEIVHDAIAPDHLQYALRLARWTRQPVAELLPDDDIDKELSNIPVQTHSMATGQLRHIAAAAHLAGNLHDLDHAKDRAKARAEQSAAALHAGQLLVQAAVVQSEVYGFNLVEAFNSRLDHLRQRFNVPQPDYNARLLFALADYYRSERPPEAS